MWERAGLWGDRRGTNNAVVGGWGKKWVEHGRPIFGTDRFHGDPLQYEYPDPGIVYKRAVLKVRAVAQLVSANPLDPAAGSSTKYAFSWGKIHAPHTT